MILDQDQSTINNISGESGDSRHDVVEAGADRSSNAKADAQFAGNVDSGPG
jgi:hypothetical protein